MRSKHLVTLLFLLALAVASALTPAHAGGVVSVCDEAHLLAALAGGGTVTFSCSGTITLTSTITIATNTTIDSSGQNVTISGNHLVRPFSVNSGSTLNLNRLAVAKGMSGSSGSGIINFGTLILDKTTFSGDVSIYNQGTLIANDSAFSGNGASVIVNAGTAGMSNDTFSANNAPFSHGGGIYNSGALIVSNSTFSNNSARDGGGGICNLGTLTVNNSAFSGNTVGGGARDGGGIYNSGTLTVSNSTFSNNSARFGGAIYSVGTSIARTTLTVNSSTFLGNRAVNSPDSPMGYGGGIYNAEGTLTVSNSTFSGNSADDGGGGIFNDGQYYSPATVSNSTFSGNSAAVGGGIRQFGGGAATLKNTIMANSPTGGNCSGGITDGGGNLSYPDTTCPGINGDPVLGPLQNNGGPTRTTALRPGSAALDAADDAICAAPPVNNLDQRGYPRPLGAHCDIGAYELFQPTDYVYLPIIMR